MKMRFYIYKYCARHLGEDRIKDICMRNNVPGFFFAYGKNFWFALIKEFPEDLLIRCDKVHRRPSYLYPVSMISASKRPINPQEQRPIINIGTRKYIEHYFYDVFDYVDSIKDN